MEKLANTTAPTADMPILRSKEEVIANSKMLAAIYRFYLFQKGYRRTYKGEITAAQVKETREKYNLSESISDLDLGTIEGKIFLSMMLETFYDKHFDEGHVAWIKGLISLYINKIGCFIFKCAINKPQISTSPTYDFAGKFDSKLCDLAAVLEEHRSEVKNWYCTPYEFGYLCGFVSAAHWAIGEKWAFSEEDFDAPIDWGRFHSYLEKCSSKLKRRKVQEMSPVFQIFLAKPQHQQEDRNSDRNGASVPVHNRRCKLPIGSGEISPALPTLPKPSSWLDW